jgi:glycosyltransferase involved in cell wall biosynthesis
MAEALRAKVASFDYVRAPMIDWQAAFSNPEKALKNLKESGHIVGKRLKSLKVDIVFCQGTSMIPFLETDKPIVAWHDSTWDCLLQLDFDEFKSCHPLLHDWDQMVLDRSSLVIFAADWLRDAALARYDVAPEKIAVVPFGANLEPRNADATERAIRTRATRPCQLTFLGIDWIRKGLPAAYSLMDRLNRDGLPTTLTIIGNDQITDGKSDSAILLGLRLRGDKRVRIEGFLDKSRRTDRARLNEILATTHFLVHPAEFECFGIALAEANAYGVPVLAIDQFGPRSIVRDGLNGRLFNPQTFVKGAAQFIQESLTAGTYQSLAQSAFREYQTRLNWTVCVEQLLTLLEQPKSGTVSSLAGIAIGADQRTAPRAALS